MVRRSIGWASAVAAVAILSACQSVPEPKWPVPDGIATMPVNGYPMAYRAEGRGPVIVVVHGVLCDLRCHAAQLRSPDLNADHRVVAVSLRRFWPEPWDGKGPGFSAKQHARDVAAFIERIADGAPVVLVGHSYGAHVAYETARLRPGLVRKLVLAEPHHDSLAPGADTLTQEERLRAARATAEMLETRGREAGTEFAVDRISGAGSWAKIAPPNRVVPLENAWTVVASGLDDAPDVSCAQFGSLPMPVLLVRGEATTPRFRRIVDEQAKCLPRASLVVIPKAGHGAPYQNPQAFNAAVAEFIRR